MALARTGPARYGCGKPERTSRSSSRCGDCQNPREDEYYELWFVDDDGRMSGGTFQVEPEGWASVNLTAPAVAQTYPAVGTTREPDDGDPRLSREKGLGGELQASCTADSKIYADSD